MVCAQERPAGIDALLRQDFQEAHTLLCEQPLMASDASHVIAEIRRYVEHVMKWQSNSAFRRIVECLGRTIAGGPANAQFDLGKVYQALSERRLHDDWLQKSAAGGYPEALFILAGERERATGILDMESLRRAAEGGYPDAQYAIAQIYSGRDGRPKGRAPARDYAEALKWYEKLGTREGYEGPLKTSAQATVGWMYYLGQGTQVDYETALKWFNLAVSGVWYPGARTA